MAARYAWVLNLDADVELSRPVGYNPTARVQQNLELYRAKITALLGETDVCLPDVALDRPTYRGYVGRAWCPTPRALRLLAASGAEVPKAPPLACLQRVASRRFNAELGQSLPGACYVTDAAHLHRLVATERGPRGCVLKRNFGFAGRGQRRISGALQPDDERWVAQALAQGGLQFEPWVDLEQEVALHGYLQESGAVTFGAICGQRTDARGAWLESFRLGRGVLAPQCETELFTCARHVADALHTEGYFGPFGIDAFVYWDGQQRAFNPKSDVNPRYTMGYAVGMQGSAP